MDTTDVSKWDEEGVKIFVDHIAREFDGSHGIFAKAAATSGDIDLQRTAVRQFFADKLPGGHVALAALGGPSYANVPGMPLEAPPIETWENRAFEMASNKMACMSPSEIERYAATTGLPLDEVRRQLWKVTFDASLRDSWQRKARKAA